VIPARATRERLAEIGIDLWVRRDRKVVENAVAGARPAVPGHEAAPRLRLASGEGDWLLVQDEPWDGRHDRLLGDIQATIGSARCRFAQWAHSDSAGVAVDELDSRSVRHVLAFGKVPAGAGAGPVLVVPSLAELAGDGGARRRLWRSLSAALDD